MFKADPAIVAGGIQLGGDFHIIIVWSWLCVTE